MKAKKEKQQSSLKSKMQKAKQIKICLKQSKTTKNLLFALLFAFCFAHHWFLCIFGDGVMGSPVPKRESKSLKPKKNYKIGQLHQIISDPLLQDAIFKIS